MQLRPYQEIAVQKGIEYFSSSSDRPSLIVAPTAYGKSVVVSSIAHQLSGKTVVLQPSKELLEQNFQKLMALGGMASIYSASMGEKEFGEITYATIGSIKNLGKQFKEYGYTNVIIDEVHNFPPDSDSMAQTFLTALGTKKVLGFTATPFRLQTTTNYKTGYRESKLAMLTSRMKAAGYFKDILHVHQISEMVKSGYWSKLKYEEYDFDTGNLKMNSTGAEFTDKSIEVAYEQNSINHRIARKIRESDRKSILVFVPTVKIAYELQRMVKDSVVVHGDLSKSERDLAIKGFKKGFYRVAVNVNVLSVGFDYPGIDSVILGRPTASLAWYYQAVGRGTRIMEGKEDCEICDFVGNVSRFGRVEDLTIEHDGHRWEVWNNDIQLTSIPIAEIGTVRRGAVSEFTMPFGKYRGQSIDKVPKHYMEWMLKEVTWHSGNRDLKEKILEKLGRKMSHSIPGI